MCNAGTILVDVCCCFTSLRHLDGMLSLSCRTSRICGFAYESTAKLTYAGNSDNAAYLANVCVAQSARRQGVGGALMEAARQRARTWGKRHIIHIIYSHWSITGDSLVAVADMLQCDLICN